MDGAVSRLELAAEHVRKAPVDALVKPTLFCLWTAANGELSTDLR